MVKFTWQLTEVDPRVWALFKPVDPGEYARQGSCVVCGCQMVKMVYTRVEEGPYVRVYACETHISGMTAKLPPGASVLAGEVQNYQPLVSARMRGQDPWQPKRSGRW